MNASDMTQLPDGSGCFTATILTQAEIDTLPLKKRPISARISSEMYHDVFEKVGEASMAWSPRPTGVFASEQASDVAVKLCFAIANEVEKRVHQALIRASEICDLQTEPKPGDDESESNGHANRGVGNCKDAILVEAKKYE